MEQEITFYNDGYIIKEGLITMEVIERQNGYQVNVKHKYPSYNVLRASGYTENEETPLNIFEKIYDLIIFQHKSIESSFQQMLESV